MHKLTTILIGCGFALLPLAANAYIGPGAGLSLLGALWAVIVAIATAVFFVIAWPVRRMRRRKREAKERETQEREPKERETQEREPKERAAGSHGDDTASTTPDTATPPPSGPPHRSQRR